MTPRYIDWIWHVRGSLPLAAEQSVDEAFHRLDPLFRQAGTSRRRSGDTLTFEKKDQAAQDKMSVFDSGVLRIEQGVAGPILHYHLVSRALLFCFLAPLLFIGIAQVTIAVNSFYAPGTGPAAKLARIKEEARKQAAKAKLANLPMNPIDKALGAPAPEKPGKNKGKKDSKAPTTTPAYVFAAIFATLYIVGRILEDKLVRSLFRGRLAEPLPAR